MAALIPLLRLPGVARAIDRRLPAPIAGIASLVANPVSTLFNKAFGTIPGAQDPNRIMDSTVESVIDRILGRGKQNEQAPYTPGDGSLYEGPQEYSLEHRYEQPQFIEQPAAETPSELFMQDVFERVNYMTPEERATTLGAYENNWPSDVKVLQMERAAQMADNPPVLFEQNFRPAMDSQMANERFDSFGGGTLYDYNTMDAYKRGGVVMPSHYSNGRWKLI